MACARAEEPDGTPQQLRLCAPTPICPERLFCPCGTAERPQESGDGQQEPGLALPLVNSGLGGPARRAAALTAPNGEHSQ